MKILEKQIEDILCKYPELIEDGLTVTDRQKTIHKRRMDILFKDKYGRDLIVELKRGAIKDEHLGQILSYEGLLLSADDPTIRVMLIGNRVPPNIQKSLDHHGIAWKEISYSRLKEFVGSKKDVEFSSFFLDEQLDITINTPKQKNKKNIEKSTSEFKHSARSGNLNIHDEIKRLAPNLNESFKAGDMYYAGNIYPTKERVVIKSSGAIILKIDSKIGEHFSKILKDKCVPYKVDQDRYKCYNATNLRKAGLID